MDEFNEEQIDHDHCEVCGCNKGAYYALKERVEESKQRITLMESEFLQSTLYTENELDECREELRLLKQQYNALEKSHQELHEVNTDLEERILDIAAAYEKEKQALNREVLTLSQKLLDTKFEINKMEEKNNRYKKDCELAVQLLQCTPSGAYMQHKVSALPHELQYYVHQIMGEMQGTSNNMKRSSTFSGGVGGGPTTGNSTSNPDPNQPLLGSSGQSSNGFLASRVYCNVPANIIAQAMQRRDEDEKKEMERMMPMSRHRSKESSKTSASQVALQDKGTQTLALGPSGQKEVLCARCGADLDVEAAPVDTSMGVVNRDTSTTGGVVSVMNLLDLSEPVAPPPPPPAGPSNTSLLLDLLGGPLEENNSEGEKSTDNVSLTDLIIDGPPLMDSKSSGAGSDGGMSSPQKQPTPAGSVSSLDAISVSSSASKESKPATPSNAASLLPEAEAAAASAQAAQNSMFAKVNMAARRHKQSSGTQRNNNNDNETDEHSDTSEEQIRTAPTNKPMTSDPITNDTHKALHSEGESTPTSAHSMEDLSPVNTNNKNNTNHISSKVDNRKQPQVNGSMNQENDNEKSANSQQRAPSTNSLERREMKGLNNTERSMKGLISNPDRRDQVRKPGIKASQQGPPKGGPAHLYLQTSV